MPRTNRDYDYQDLKEEREYGLFWYSGLWNLLRPVFIVLVSLLILFGLFSHLWNRFSAEYIDPVDETSTEEFVFVIDSGSSLTRVANNLQSAGLIRSSSVFKYYCDFLGMGQKIQAGTYAISPSIRLNELAELLTTGDGNPITTNITVIPGWTVENIADYLVRRNILSDRDELLSLCRTGDAYRDYYYIADLLATPNVGQRLYALEGYLTPNTYEIYTNATADDIVRKLLGQTEKVVGTRYDRAEALGMTMDQVLTMASMIEKEAKTDDFAKVSAVFHNRIKAGMSLGSDVTIKYVTGSTNMVLSQEDLSVNSLYNTYRYTGLPLGPVCNPSAAAIDAALYPDETFLEQNYLYFCSTDPNQGTLYFSRTYEEHQQAVAIYSPLWVEYDTKQKEAKKQ